MAEFSLNLIEAMSNPWKSVPRLWTSDVRTLDLLQNGAHQNNSPCAFGVGGLTEVSTSAAEN